MEKIERIELGAHRSEIISEVKSLREKYRAIFDWDEPGIDQTVADELILVETRTPLAEIEKKAGLSGTSSCQPATPS